MGVVSWYLDRASGLDGRVAGVVTFLVALAAVVVLVGEALRASGTLRRAWGGVAAACLTWGAVFGAVEAGAPDWTVTWVGRPVAFIALTLGITAFPGVARPLRDWLVVVGDGWMSVGGWFVVVWLFLHHPSIDHSARLTPGQILWLVADGVILSVLAGLLTRAADSGRRPVAYVLLAGMIAGTGDLIWAVTGSAQAGFLLWTVTVAMVGAAPLVGDGDMFSSTFVDRGQHREIRFMQLPWLPAVVFLYGPVEPDRVATVAAAGVLIVCFLNVSGASRQNGRLLRTVSKQSRQYERQARTDVLTGLGNRSAFLGAVQGRLDSGLATTVLFVDLDDFKTVNDTLGHAAGDALLRRVAGLLQDAADADDVVARLGGDEFAVMLASAAGQGEDCPLERARAVHAVLAGAGGVAPAGTGPGRASTASIGVATASRGSAEDLLRDADLAMYYAKHDLGGGVARSEPWLQQRVVERSRTLTRLDTAVRTGGLHLELQPVVRLDDGSWEGFEALVRWQDGDVRRAPDEFVPLAEESGLVVPMGAWVLREALRQLGTWPDAGAGIAVNVSPQQLEQDDFAAMVLEALAVADIAPDRLTLEITEQTAVADLGRTASRLQSLRDRGIHVSIDDFGTGFSSMRYLTRLPVDALKIDRQFVDGLGRRPEDEVLVASMLRLAADLGLEVVAEGVEHEEQAARLRELGCRLAQGFFYSRPRPLADLRQQARVTVPRPRAVTVGETQRR